MKSIKSLIPLLALAALTGAAPAATINWGLGAKIVTNSNEISTTGTLVTALDIGSGTSRTINGVTFKSYQSFAAGAAGNYDVFNTYTVAGTGPGTVGNGSWGDSAFYASYGTPGGILGVDAAAYGAALNDGMYVGGNPSTRTQTLTGLVAGQQYELQVWFSDMRTANKTMTYAGSSPMILQSGSTSGKAQYGIGTFIADGNGQQVLSYTSDATGGATINMFQLRAIPEPSTALLGAFGALALLRRRR